jgi:hypothetical protein
MPGDQRGHRLSVGREGFDRRDVIVAHQAAVVLYIGAENRREPALDLRGANAGGIARMGHRDVFGACVRIFRPREAFRGVREQPGRPGSWRSFRRTGAHILVCSIWMLRVLGPMGPRSR